MFRDTGSDRREGRQAAWETSSIRRWRPTACAARASEVSSVRESDRIIGMLDSKTAPAPEQVARALALGADEKVLLVLAAAGWLASRGRTEPLRRASGADRYNG
jgi:hypothetical protein